LTLPLREVKIPPFQHFLILMTKKLLIAIGTLLPLLILIPKAEAQNYSYDCMCLYAAPNGACMQYTCDSYRTSRYRYDYDSCSYGNRYVYSTRCGSRYYPTYYDNDRYDYGGYRYPYDGRYSNSYYNDYDWYYSRYGNRSPYRRYYDPYYDSSMYYYY
jgi:hypothetical protein